MAEAEKKKKKVMKKVQDALAGRTTTIKEFAKLVSEGEVEVQVKKKSISFYLKNAKDNTLEFLFGLTGTIKAENIKTVENCVRCNSEARKKELEEKTTMENDYNKFRKEIADKEKDLAQREKELERFKRLKEIEEQKINIEKEKAQILKDNMEGK
jgi:hypothetical protein